MNDLFTAHPIIGQKEKAKYMHRVLGQPLFLYPVIILIDYILAVR